LLKSAEYALEALEKAMLVTRTEDLGKLYTAYAAGEAGLKSAGQVAGVVSKASLALGIVGLAMSVFTLNQSTQCLSKKDEGDEQLRAKVDKLIHDVAQDQNTYDKIMDVVKSHGTMPDMSSSLGMYSWITHTGVASHGDDQTSVFVPIGEVQITEYSTEDHTESQMSKQPISKNLVVDNDQDGPASVALQLTYIQSEHAFAKTTYLWYLRQFKTLTREQNFDRQGIFKPRREFDAKMKPNFAMKPDWNQ